MIVNNEKTRDLGSGRAYSVPEKTSAINQAPRNMRPPCSVFPDYPTLIPEFFIIIFLTLPPLKPI